jgi:regulator of protease activity HflC (stomatin/prohibitin superfamily)
MESVIAAAPLVVAGIFLTYIASLFFFPIYNVWAARKQGQADLAEAQFEQQIQVAEAQARYNAAELNKKAAIIEAEAVAAQIKTIGEGLQRHDLYLKWQWIQMMEDRDGATIYVPTEANLPILEAGKRQ